MPLKLTKIYFSQLFLSGLEEPFRSRAISAIGELAGALVILFSEYGSLYQPEHCCEEADLRCTRTPLIELFPNNWVEQYNSIIKQYGWSDSTVSGQQQAVDLLRLVFDRQADREEKATLWHSVTAGCKIFIESRLERDLIEDEYDPEMDRILDPACHIAIDAVATATCKLISGTRRIVPPSEIPFNFVNDFVQSLLSFAGMEVSEYLKLALTKILPRKTPFDAADVVISSNGYTAGISSLWEISVQKSDALAIRVCKGVIKREDSLYERIQEVDVHGADKFHEQEMDTLRLFQEDAYLGLKPRCDEDNSIVRMRMAVAGTNLELRTYLTGAKGYLRPLSWRQSIIRLAVATHVNKPFEYTARQEEQLARRYSNAISEAYWQSCSEWGHEDVEERMILKTSGNEELRFFSCGIVHQERKIRILQKCLTLVIRHSGPLLSCVLEAQSTNRAWAIVC